MKKKGYNLIQVIIIIIITSIVSALAVGVLYTKGFSGQDGIRYAELLKDEHLKEFLDVYHEIVNEYYEDINREKAIQSAINGLVTYLDESYTTYMNPDEATALKEVLYGTYYGIGITIKDKKISSVYPGSPASNNGLLTGDEIISINGTLVLDKNNTDILNLISKNENNRFVVGREGSEIEIVVPPLQEKVPSVEHSLIQDSQIGYLRINVFSKGSAQEVKQSMAVLEDLGIQSLIIDLRNNTGGYLNEVYESAEIFLAQDKVVYSLSEKKGVVSFKDRTEDHTNYPIAVLVNDNTASAAEILAAALKDSYNAMLIGKTTYGKGKVQHTYNLNTGGLVKYTTSKWLRPNGLCIDGIGIDPDYIVLNDVEYNDGIASEVDNQLKQGIELLNN